MKIQWIGHSAFVITTEQNKTILTDPYDANCYDGALRYIPITVAADVVTASHDHADHFTKKLKGSPEIITKSGFYEVSGIKMKGIPVFHDTVQGKERGANIIFIYEIDGIRLVHLGDLGHVLSEQDVSEIGSVDILLIPVGGHFTIDAKSATTVVEMLNPRIAIPMHYKTEVLDFPIAGVDDFIRNKKGVEKVNSSEVTVTRETLPAEPGIWVLQYAK